MANLFYAYEQCRRPSLGFEQGVAECDAAYEQKFQEWAARDWPEWLAKHLTFPFTVNMALC